MLGRVFKILVQLQERCSIVPKTEGNLLIHLTNSLTEAGLEGELDSPLAQEINEKR